MDYDREYFRGKTAAVTGAASGIGLTLAEELLKSNAAKVVMADFNQDHLSQQEKRLQAQYGDRVKGIFCDVTVEENVQHFIAASAEFFGGRFDLLFNNAGKGFYGPFENPANEDWKAAFDVNFYSAVYGMRAVLPLMIQQGGGQIINVISGIAFSPMPYQSRYSATKAALNGLSLCLRYEYWDRNIKISSATPGTTATAIFGDMKPPESAQTPYQSASRILHGVVNNDRVILGDDPDVEGAKDCFDPRAQAGKDQYFLSVARQRSKGKLVF